MAGTITLDDETRTVIARMRVEGNIAKLPPEQLARPLYEKVNKALVALGGKWNRGKGGHVFPESPATLLDQAAGNGSVIDKKKLYNAFYTPKAVAERAVYRLAAGRANRMLEPSAGDGALIRAAWAEHPRINIVAVEIDDPVARKLRSDYPELQAVFAGDFFDQTESDLGDFDRILMNPPFENGADIKHIRHALTFLRPGGRLVVICADGPRQNAALRDRVSSWEPLPEGSFKEAGTLVNAALIVIDAP